MKNGDVDLGKTPNVFSIAIPKKPSINQGNTSITIFPKDFLGSLDESPKAFALTSWASFLFSFTTTIVNTIATTTKKVVLVSLTITGNSAAEDIPISFAKVSPAATTLDVSLIAVPASKLN